MNKKMLYAAIITALMVCSIFAAIKIGTVHSAITNGMAMDPTINTVLLPEGGSDLTFRYVINITTTVTNVTAWEAKLLWDPAVLRALGVVWGTFMTGGTMTNSTAYSGGGESILLGQSFDEQVTGITGSGWLASVNFTFVLPGATFVRFLEANVTNDNMVSYNLLANSASGRVTTNMPHPQFWWWTSDDANNNGTANDIDGYAHGEGPIPTQTLTYGDRVLPDVGTIVHFTANLSYATTLMTWNATSGTYYLSGSQPYGIGTVYWDYGDGTSEIYTGGNFTQITEHQYTSYNKDGWLVNLTVYTGVGMTGVYWSSTWRYMGSAPDDIVPMWEDVGIVDIWPSLIPFQNWNPYMNGTWGSDWFSPWWFDSTDFFIPSVNDAYWNYTVPPEAGRYWNAYTGSTVPAADKRLYPTYAGYTYGSYVKQAGYFSVANDTDVGKTLTRFNAPPAGKTYLYYDHDFTGAYSNNDSIVLINSALGGRVNWNTADHLAYSAIFNSTLGDVAYNQPVVTGSNCTGAISSYVRFYDTNSDTFYNAGEPIYYDYYPRGIVLGQWQSVKQAYAAIEAAAGTGDLYKAIGAPYPGTGLQGEGPGLNVLVTANNFGSITEDCTVNLYAIGVALKVSGSNWATYTPVETVDVEQIGQWTGVTMAPHSGTGWNLACNWLPTKNLVYVLVATIETQQSETMEDQDLSNNWMAMSKPVCNIAMWNMTSLAMIPPGWVISEYLCDPKNTGTVNSVNLGNLLTMWIRPGNPFYGKGLIPKSP